MLSTNRFIEAPPQSSRYPRRQVLILVTMHQYHVSHYLPLAEADDHEEHHTFKSQIRRQTCFRRVLGGGSTQ